MKFLTWDTDTKLLDKDVKNKWGWEWLFERDSQGQQYEEWLKKTDSLGMAYCEACNRTISYKSSRKKELRMHAEDAKQGVAKSIKEELKEKLKDRKVSLNIDEATSYNNVKILNIIVQYYDLESSRVVIDHLGSRKQN